MFLWFGLLSFLFSFRFLFSHLNLTTTNLHNKFKFFFSNIENSFYFFFQIQHNIKINRRKPWLKNSKMRHHKNQTSNLTSSIRHIFFEQIFCCCNLQKGTIFANVLAIKKLTQIPKQLQSWIISHLNNFTLE